MCRRGLKDCSKDRFIPDGQDTPFAKDKDAWKDPGYLTPVVKDLVPKGTAPVASDQHVFTEHYEFIPHVYKDGGGVVYYEMKNRQSGRVDYTINPDEFKGYADNEAAVWRGANRFYSLTTERKSTIESQRSQYELLRGHFSDSLKHLGTAWSEALKEPETYIEALISLGVVTKSIPKASYTTSNGRWKVGDDIYNPTAAGNDPSWTTVRNRFWKNEAAKPDAEAMWGLENIQRMKKGLAPQRYNYDKGGMESMDLSHEPVPYRDGGRKIVPRWPQDHAAVDPYRRPGIKMTKTLSEKFIEAKGQSIEYDGHCLIPILKLKVTDNSVLSIKRVSHKQTVEQGMRIKIDHGDLVLEENTYKDVVIWADHSPEEVTLVCKAKKKTIVKIWNVWKYNGVMHAWIGNSGMIVEEKDNQVTLSCSDGTNAPDFTDIVCEIKHT
ncbi:hypothetical protein GMSM_24710 [Geomonas sp. Red276]